ncbi:uncharacterized protein LOC111265431 isoform X2 [Varroa jacobsoni]|uniref:uncharacterized protein LOC111265431 isoform X2 n=1 Tax=Varroa jacobsoni TaxID=62625 RepID=UPI000BF9683E|nr:uncharacterized protein LOC111265431 isoform X2 [Varroa jacobsoni]
MLDYVFSSFITSYATNRRQKLLIIRMKYVTLLVTDYAQPNSVRHSCENFNKNRCTYLVLNYDEATQEKVIEAFSGLGFTDDCMDYLKSGSAEDCGRCVGSMNLTERLCIVLGGNPEVCFLRCAVKRCCSRNEEDSIEPSRYNRERHVPDRIFCRYFGMIVW